MGQRGLKVVGGAPSDGGALLTAPAKAKMFDFHLSDLIRHLGETMPFTVGATGVAPKMSGTRLAETLIISSITGAVVILGTLYVAQPVTDTKLMHMTEQMRELRTDVKEMQTAITMMAMQVEIMKQRQKEQ